MFYVHQNCVLVRLMLQLHSISYMHIYDIMFVQSTLLRHPCSTKGKHCKKNTLTCIVSNESQNKQHMKTKQTTMLMIRIIFLIHECQYIVTTVGGN